jgi:cobalt-zinc-cadmium efflux system protein
MHAHSHSAGHSHHNHAHPTGHGRAFLIGIILNLGFVAIEAVYGILADSMALLSDAGHNLSDVLGLAIAGGAALLAKRGRTERFTYGLRSSSILAALFNAVLLLVAVGGIVWESIDRLVSPPPVAAITVMIVAGVGIIVNGFTALLFMQGGHDDLNIRGAFLHMVADAAVSLGVVLGGAAILWTGQTWIDPVLSLLIGAVIVWSTWGLLRQSLTLSLQGVPSGIAVSDVQRFLENRPGVARVHHLHIWAMSTTETALTVHLVIPGGHPGNHFLVLTQRELKNRFGIGHTTLQIEIDAPHDYAPDHECPLDDPGHDHKGRNHGGHQHHERESPHRS